jgi:hypothetical protein
VQCAVQYPRIRIRMCPQVNDPRVEYSVCLLDAEYVDGHDSIAQTWFFVYKADARLRLMEAKV